MDKIANMEAFAAVSQAGSFAEAAKKLNLANSVVSKRIKDLEDHLGSQLLVRTTRKVTLTQAGQDYLIQVQRVLDEIKEIESGVRYRTQKPVGVIRLTAPLSFGLQTLAPALADYLVKYPDVSIKTYLSDRHVDLVSEGYDLAIRIGALEDQNLMAKKLSRGRRVVCATPQYLKKYGRPVVPSDLKSHNCLSYLNLAEGKSWPFMIDGKRIWQQVSGNFYSDNGDLLYQAALASCGVTLLPTFIIEESLKNKELEIVLEDYEEKDFDIYAVYQGTRHLSVKIRTLIDHLAAFF
ncbi:MAG: LysR family transcriptional regulator [Micavibrio aeruginosavorus]|uniref:LysR family transcriptional regulator n=1 Tax=Micavibrio aeruginosavorus TaxID=349221 RepID=A0A2W5FMA5_9BACT|nr:MAG: LysR family transcriptional regulator [Micavibrio aeruginosavorus]